MHSLEVSPETVHWGYFDATLKPALRVKPGESVRIETFSYPRGEDFPELLNPRLAKLLPKLEFVGPGPHLLTGPIYVEGAEPGDVLAVHIDSIEPLLPYGYNRIQKGSAGLGLLPEDFPEGRLKLLPLDLERKVVRVIDGFEAPMRTFFGIMAVAPAEDGRIGTRAPGNFGGNIDITELTSGSTLYLPVFRPGALFSAGDGHTAQGDGEVDLSAAETSLVGELRFEIRKDFAIQRPMAETKAHFITTGFHEDLDEAAKIATRDMISWLSQQHNLEPIDAYTLCTLALDLRVSQLVNGRKGIHAMLPKSVFAGSNVQT